MNNDQYTDIINLPHHVSAARPRMSMIDRAAQFSPFAALTGYDAAIKETGRLTEQRIDLSEEERSILDRKQRILMDNIAAQPEISVTYFVPDARKDGGAYVTIAGRVRRVDAVARLLILVDRTEIPLDDVISLDGVLFGCIE